MKKRIQLLFFVLIAGSLSEARSFTKTFTTGQAKEPGITAQLCQADMMVVTLPRKVKSVGLSLPDNVEVRRDENRVILMGKISKGRTPILIFMKETNNLYRLHLDACLTRGAITMINIVDNSKAIHLKNPNNVKNNEMTELIKRIITLPAPKSVKFEASKKKESIVLRIENNSSKNLKLNSRNLKIVADKQLIKINGPADRIIRTGMSISFTFPLSKENLKKSLLIEWLIQVPEVKAEFKLRGTVE